MTRVEEAGSKSCYHLQTECGGAQIISSDSLQQDLQKLTRITFTMDISIDAKRGGGFLIFSYIRRLGPLSEVQNFELRKMNILGV